MGVDYDAISGIGIEITEEMEKLIIKDSEWTEAEWEEDRGDCMEAYRIKITQAGSCYSGYFRYYMIVGGGNIKEINNNSFSFIKDLKDIGINISQIDLKLISDILVW